LAGDHIAQDLVDQGVAEVGLGLEVVEEGAFGDADAAQDVVDGGCLKAVQVDLLLAGLEQQAPSGARIAASPLDGIP